MATTTATFFTHSIGGVSLVRADDEQFYWTKPATEGESLRQYLVGSLGLAIGAPVCPVVLLDGNRVGAWSCSGRHFPRWRRSRRHRIRHRRGSFHHGRARNSPVAECIRGGFDFTVSGAPLDWPGDRSRNVARATTLSICHDWLAAPADFEVLYAVDGVLWSGSHRRWLSRSVLPSERLAEPYAGDHAAITAAKAFLADLTVEDVEAIIAQTPWVEDGLAQFVVDRAAAVVARW